MTPFVTRRRRSTPPPAPMPRALTPGYSWLAPLLSYVDMPRGELLTLGLDIRNIPDSGIDNEVAANVLERAAEKLRLGQMFVKHERGE